MAKEFPTLKELFEFRSFCPICRKPLDYELRMSIIENIFSSGEDKTFSLKFSPTDKKEISIENHIINIDNNTVKIPENSFQSFSIEISCIHPELEKEYNAHATFDISNIEGDEFYLSMIDCKTNLQKLQPIEANHNHIVKVWFSYEKLKILNANQSYGSLITILNDFDNQKTSFSIFETNLDGTNKTYKEKRIDLVGEDFFDYSNPISVYNRVNSLFLLDDK